MKDLMSSELSKLMTTAEVASLPRVDRSTRSHWRSSGSGPRVTFRTFDTRRAAQAWLARERAALAGGVDPLGPLLPRPTHVESARGAVSVLPPVCFPGPLAEPVVPISRQRALHGCCRQAGFVGGQGVGI
jgi:hypothetical protein